ncbi:unnamed protein product [Camellia sinensis]
MLLLRLRKIFVHSIQGRRELVPRLEDPSTTKDPFSIPLLKDQWLRVVIFLNKMNGMHSLCPAVWSSIEGGC